MTGKGFRFFEMVIKKKIELTKNNVNYCQVDSSCLKILKQTLNMERKSNDASCYHLNHESSKLWS